MFGPLSRFLALFAALFSAFGVASPFLPALLASKGLNPSSIGIVLCRRHRNPFAGRPRRGTSCRSFPFTPPSSGGLLIAASIIALGYLPAYSLMLVLAVSVLHTAVLAPLVPIADALTLGAARMRHFEYGWVRGAGSAAFILGTVLSGFAIGRCDLPVFVWLNAVLLLAASLFALNLPRTPRPDPPPGRASAGMLSLLRLPWFARLMLVASLVQGSHALHDGFAVIRWQAAGLLWSEAVAAEVLVFAGLGRPLIDRLGPSGAAMLAASAGILRWGVMAQTSWLPTLAIIEPLYGLTFALLHLACMRPVTSHPAQRRAIPELAGDPALRRLADLFGPRPQ